jgi:hypothetical protein
MPRRPDVGVELLDVDVPVTVTDVGLGPRTSA